MSKESKLHSNIQYIMKYKLRNTVFMRIKA